MAETIDAQSQRSSWTPILPVPEDAPAPRITHPVRGAPLRVFTYYDTEGRTLGYVCRFSKSTGGIATMTLTWCRNDSDGSRAWRWIQFPKLRPLYGADRLQRDEELGGERLKPLSIVLIVGDELTADEIRAHQHSSGWTDKVIDGLGGAKLQVRDHPFLAYDVVSWPGGRSKIGEVDWSPLRGRVCAIWFPHSAERFKVGKGDPGTGAFLPLEKQPWRVAARRLMDTLREHGAIPISITEAATTEELPDGWDPVRALDSGWTLAQLREWFDKHFATQAEIEEANRLARGAGPDPTKASGKDPDWARTLIREEGVGRLLAELHNVRKILTHHDAWRGVIFYDLQAHSVQKAKAPPFDLGQAGEWSDNDDSMAADWLASECGIRKLKTTLVAEGVQIVAKLHARNPLVDYLEGLKWDRKPRLDGWLKNYLKAGPLDSPDLTESDAKRLEEYLRIVGRKWLLGAVARALKPGCKFDYVLILEGQQGLGKSTAFAILGGQWTMDTPFSLGDKEGMETIRGMWIVEVSELDAFNKAESTLAKSFFSRTKDRFRLPYGKRSANFARTCVFGGTTNEDEYFRDPTGNRRYWPVRCSRNGYDKAELARVRDQLLAEAVAAIKAGEQIWPSAAEERVIKLEQSRREIPDPWVGRIARWLQDPMNLPQGTILTRELLLAKAIGVEAARIDERGMATRVGKAMHKLGYEKVEDKSIPERFRYAKRRSSDEGDE